MLKLSNITKIYAMGETKVEALKGVSLCFRKNEFVSILGPSGCGKTTMLNIVGGLDRYTDGDLVIGGRSTKEYVDKDWDSYRNHSIGFVFQSYNLIPHQTVLENVELALTLSGVSKQERKNRAKAVLEKVGLSDKLNNKPSQLSGGQMQRVAIARALVNDPKIILADEPTGALDTETSVQIMNLLKEISKDKLIIMVTHNPELAEQYSNRIVKLLDGNVIDDTNPYSEEEETKETGRTQKADIKKEEKEGLTKKEKKTREKKKRMSFWTALSLSFKNLLTKKARTILVAFAGSIGIIGIALILAVSSGFSTYINKMQEDTLSTSPITIESKKVDFASIVSSMFLAAEEKANTNNPDDGVYVNQNISTMMNSVGSSLGTNNLEKFYAYIEKNYDDLKDYVTAVQCTYNLGLEFYLDQENVNIVQSVAVEPDPNSRALMTMITKYALFYFEDKTGINATQNATGGYTFHRPTNIGAAPLTGDALKQAYPFIYSSPSYETNLGPIAVGLENSANGTIDIASDKILGLVFAILDIDFDMSAMGTGSSMMSMFGGLSIFNEMIDNQEFINSQYDLLAGEYVKNDAEHAGEAYLVLDANNELDDYVLYGLGLLSDEQMDKVLKGIVENKKVDDPIDFDSILGKTYKVLDKIDYYVLDAGTGKYIDFRLYNTSVEIEVDTDDDGINDSTEETNPYFDKTNGAMRVMQYYKQAYDNCTNEVKIVGIVRTNETTKSGSLTSGVAYTKHFTNKMINERNDKIAEFKETDADFNDVGLINTKVPNQIALYIKSFESKEGVVEFIDTYNAQAEKDDQITYTDVAGFIMSTVSTIINAITYVLIAFVSVSLVVSSIMIGIITYISVIERTKEIGVLRSVGASKRDVKRVFTAESFIIGLSSGVLGIAVSLLLTIPINIIFKHFTGIAGLAYLPFWGSVTLIVISILLTFISGLIPAKAAAKKDPVIALREN